jgi:hypothetical protein
MTYALLWNELPDEMLDCSDLACPRSHVIRPGGGAVAPVARSRGTGCLAGKESSLRMGSDTKNVIWKTPISGQGFSQPIIWKDMIFLTTDVETGSAPPANQRGLRSRSPAAGSSFGARNTCFASGQLDAPGFFSPVFPGASDEGNGIGSTHTWGSIPGYSRIGVHDRDCAVPAGTMRDETF